MGKVEDDMGKLYSLRCPHCGHKAFDVALDIIFIRHDKERLLSQGKGAGGEERY